MLELQDIKHQIIHAKSDEKLKEFPSECVDMVITSPPYDDLRDYEGVAAWNYDVFKEVAKELYRIIKPGGVVVWVIGDKTFKGCKSLKYQLKFSSAPYWPFPEGKSSEPFGPELFMADITKRPTRK